MKDIIAIVMETLSQAIEAGITRALKNYKFPVAMAVSTTKPAARRGRRPVSGISSSGPLKEDRAWAFGKGIRSMRKKLGVSQAELGKLMGVSSQAVTLWESKSGKLRLRKKTMENLIKVREMGAREARKTLEAMGHPKKRPGRKAKKNV